MSRQTDWQPACLPGGNESESVRDFQPEACPSLRWWGRAAVGDLRGTPLRLKWGGHRRTLGPGMSSPTNASQAAGSPEAVAVCVAGEGVRCPPPRVSSRALSSPALLPPEQPRWDPTVASATHTGAGGKRCLRPAPSGSGGEAGEEAAVAPEVVRPGPPWRVGPQEAEAGRVSGQVRLSTSESSESDEVWVCPV